VNSGIVAAPSAVIPSRRSGTQRAKKYARIERERAALDVLDIEIELFAPGKRVAAGDLGEPGDPGTHAVTTAMSFVVPIQIPGEQRPRSHETHVASQNVPQLR
jgi:hypothetical protein